MVRNRIPAHDPVPQLLAELELLGNGLVTGEIGRVEIIQQTPPLTNHHQQSTPGAVVLLVLLKVLSQMIDPLREQRNLHICRTRVPFVELEITYRFRLWFHTFQFSNSSKSISFSISRQSVVFEAKGVKHFPDPGNR